MPPSAISIRGPRRASVALMNNAHVLMVEIPDAKPGLAAQVPNAISIGRLAAAPMLIWLACIGDEQTFKWLLLAALLSDIADGLIARGFHLTTTLGAKLDSIADKLTSIAALAGLVAFRLSFVNERWPALATVIGFYVLSDLTALWRYGRLASFHTYLARAAAYAQGIFIMTLFIWGLQPWMLWAMVALSVAAYCEEIAITAWILPTWRANVRGIYWLMQEGRAS
jgi:cardiolipin synthase (CMP-forming)